MVGLGELFKRGGRSIGLGSRHGVDPPLACNCPWHQLANSSNAHGQTDRKSVIGSSTTAVHSAGFCFVFLQSGEKAFHRRVVPALADTAHAALDPVLLQQALIVVAGILTSPITVPPTAPRQATVVSRPFPGHQQPAGSPCCPPATSPPRVASRDPRPPPGIASPRGSGCR